MRGILILCGRGWCRKAVIRAPAGAWAAEEDAASRRGRRKRRRWQQRRSKGRHQRDTDGAAEGCAGRSGVREGRRDAGTPGHRRGPGGASGRRGGGRKGSVAGCGQCRKAGIRAAAGAWVAGGSAADQRGGEERGGGGVARTAEGNGRREQGTRTRRPEGVRPAGGSRKEEVGKRKSERGQGRRGPGGGPQQVNRRSPWGRKWRSRS